jgi:two-component system sensor histidine kinase CiaH
VHDGPGIAASERPKVFDRFYRGDTARARESRGTGLGLSIAHTIAERHGGRLHLADHAGGAHFVLVLPTNPG